MQVPLCETCVDDTGRELVEHGTALFPAAAYQDDMTYDGVPWHWHDELEAVLVTTGTAVIAAGQQQITLQAGDGCFINSNVLHGAWNAAGGTQCGLHSLVFHPRLIGGGAESVFWQKYLLPLLENHAFQIAALRTGQDAGALACIANAWRTYAEEPDGFEFLVRQELSCLLLSVRGLMAEAADMHSEKRLRDEARMKSMLRYIRSHLQEPLKIQDIAAAAAVSESECSRCFRGTIGTSPMRYVYQLRLQRAAELLAGTEQKVAEIGAECGFQEMSYFARAFRKQYGLTPSAYRQGKAMSSETSPLTLS